ELVHQQELFERRPAGAAVVQRPGQGEPAALGHGGAEASQHRTARLSAAAPCLLLRFGVELGAEELPDLLEPLRVVRGEREVHLSPAARASAVCRRRTPAAARCAAPTTWAP